MNRPNLIRRRLQNTLTTTSLAVLLSVAVCSATDLPDPNGPQIDITWGQIVQRASCMLSSWLDMGLRALNIGVSSACAIHIRIDDTKD